MPMLSYECCGQIEEHFYHPSEAKTERPICPECGHKMTQVHVGGPNVIWARPMSFYNDKKLEGAELDHHFATRVRSTRRADGKPEKILIDSFDKQRQFCKEEGLVNPSEVGAVEATSPDGLRTSTRGNKGSW